MNLQCLYECEPPTTTPPTPHTHTFSTQYSGFLHYMQYATGQYAVRKILLYRTQTPNITFVQVSSRNTSKVTYEVKNISRVRLQE